jgi:hypothetical protein
MRLIGRPRRDPDLAQVVLDAWKDVWGAAAPVAHLLRNDWPEEHIRFHSLPDHSTEARPGPEQD